MDKKSKILLVIFLILVAVSVYFTYGRSFITRNYEIVPISGDSTN